MSESSYSLLGLWPIINRWKKLVLAAVVLAAILSTAVALMLPNIYRSTAVFFPTNPESTDPDRLVDGGKLELGGRSEDLDRIITIGQSQPVAEQLIREFDLFKHYKAGAPGDDAAENAVLNEFSSNLKIVHNERDAIELTFEDRDKQLAARLANRLVQVIDSMNQQLTLENRRNVLGLYKQRFDFLRNEFEQSRQRLVQARRRYGIYGLEQQGRYMAREIITLESKLHQAEGSGNTAQAAGARRALQALTGPGGSNTINLERYVQGTDSMGLFVARLNDLQERLVKARGEYETADLTLQGKISSLYIVQKAYPATRKSKPVRWLIVAGSMLITLAVAVVLVTLLELYERSRRSAPPRPTEATTGTAGS
ncbi:Wzz/FepE/Etk N-terminal domain-containing protein [Hymenobacter aerophilus]|uniref:Wzz/FepE/Etk N-terminal domain-containing protein n=1 Tax=Hymenobacter aerophilus TaxID=119644 RepID=UPI0003718270|nr:Wzz/FepE/Etk N-terminal domain-containing protein [Hymenobacter aerophilus]